MNKTQFIKNKNWKKYLLEFFMLFLAVFLGFFADNLRDKSSEKSKEREYIHSLIEDVVLEKINIQKVISYNKTRKTRLDSLSKFCYNYSLENIDDRKLYYHYPFSILQRPDFLSANELTMTQLKNAGGMRLIKNKNAIKEILLYDMQQKKLEDQQKYYENYHKNSINLGLKIFNHQKVRHMVSLIKTKDTINLKATNFKLIQNDQNLLTEFGNVVDMYGGIVAYYNMLLEEKNNQADSLILKLKKEYKIK